VLHFGLFQPGIEHFMSFVQEYADSLAALTGNDFECEVCARLQSVILGFQTIPAKPQGDGGLDGFSHNGERGFCCYGPEHSAFKTTRQREKAIVEKFQADLRRLFELAVYKGELGFCENPELKTILPDGKKLQHVTLVVNWFDSHRILGPIFTAFERYKAASTCRYVDATATIEVQGPTQLAERFAVDESTIIRARQRSMTSRVQQIAQSVHIESPASFDSKMAILREIRPDQPQAIERLSERLLTDWRTALAFERELAEAVPSLHHQLEQDRGRIVARVSELMIASEEPWRELGAASEVARQILDRDFGKLYGGLVEDVSNGEIARLIGECPIGWKKPGTAHGQRG
jgi:hypothetical protein